MAEQVNTNNNRCALLIVALAMKTLELLKECKYLELSACGISPPQYLQVG